MHWKSVVGIHLEKDSPGTGLKVTSKIRSLISCLKCTFPSFLCLANVNVACRLNQTVHFTKRNEVNQKTGFYKSLVEGGYFGYVKWK